MDLDDFNAFYKIIEDKLAAKDYTQDPEEPPKKRKERKLRQNEIFYKKQVKSTKKKSK
tara:strand:- start:140 stop:313 length:174 start_codon:yes stop_codon:yes gene_type:complete